MADAVATATEELEKTGDEDQFELTHKGEVTKVTREQVIADAQKGRHVLPEVQSALDKLKKEHEELETKSEGSREFIEDYKLAVTDDSEAGDEALNRIGEAMGWNQAQMDYILEGPEEGEEEEDEDDKVIEDERPRGNGMPEQITLQHLMDNGDPALKRLLGKLQQDELTGLRTNLTDQVTSALTADEDMVKLKESTPRAYEVMENLAHKALQRRVGAEGQTPGPQLFKDIVEEVTTTMKTLGIQPNGPEMTDAKLAQMGLGGVIAEAGESLHQEKPPERVSVTHRDYKKNLLQRVAHKIRKSGGIAGYRDVPYADE